jgi:IS30 family transposase
MTGVPTYFTRPSAPYEKGAVEQLNKELRVYHAKGTDFSNVTKAELDKIAKKPKNRSNEMFGLVDTSRSLAERASTRYKLTEI